MAAWSSYDNNEKVIQVVMYPPPFSLHLFPGKLTLPLLGHDLENVILAKAVGAASLPQALVTGLKMACDRSLVTCRS